MGIEARVNAALCDGEDFELLFAIPAHLVPQLRDVSLPFPVFEIGRVTAELGVTVRLPDDSLQPLQDGGWQHHF